MPPRNFTLARSSWLVKQRNGSIMFYKRNRRGRLALKLHLFRCIGSQWPSHNRIVPLLHQLQRLGKIAEITGHQNSPAHRARPDFGSPSTRQILQFCPDPRDNPSTVQIYRRAEFTFQPGSLVCRRSRWGAWCATSVFTAIGLGAALLALRGGGLKVPPPILWWITFWMLVFGAIAAWIFRQAMRSSNWLLALSGDYCYLNTRSYLNHHFPGDPPIVELSRREILRVRADRVRIESTEDTIVRHRLIIQLRDPGGLDKLARLLDEERAIRVSARAVDFPVEVSLEAAEISVWWDSIAPSAKGVVARLQSWAGLSVPSPALSNR